MTQITRKELIALIKAHLRRTKEKPYAWSERVMGDKTFLWKLQHYGRNPYRKTVAKIRRAITSREKKMGLTSG